MNDAEHMTMPWEVREVLTGSGEVRWDIVTDDDVRWYVCRAYTGLRGDYTGEATARLICKEHNAALKAKKGGKAKAKAAKGVHITLLESALKQQTEECERLRRIILRAATAFFADGSDSSAALQMYKILEDAKVASAEGVQAANAERLRSPASGDKQDALVGRISQGDK